MATQICSGQTSYTNPNAILNVSGTATRISSTTVRVALDWSIYTAGSWKTSATRVLHLVDGNNNSYGQFAIGSSWSQNTWYNGSGTIDVSIGGGAGSLYVGCMVLTPAGTGGDTLTWDGGKGTNTGNPGIQRTSLGYGAWNAVAPTLHRVYVSDRTATTYAVFAYVTGALTNVNVATWTDHNGQDELKWVDMGNSSWIRNGQIYNYATTIQRSDHNFEYGKYNNHIYAWNGDTYAMWYADAFMTVNVIFNGNGGTSASKSVNIGTAFGTLPTSIRVGYTQTGWFTATAGGTQITAGSALNDGFNTGVANLYAQWRANTYTLSYNVNGGNAISPASKVVTYAAAIGALAVPARKGYEFIGWFTAAAGGAQVKATDIYQTIGNTTVYAQWKACTYTLSYNVNGGNTVFPASKVVTYAAAIGALPVPARKGYEFIGWFTAAAGGAQVKATDLYQTSANSTIYAQWRIITLYDRVLICTEEGKFALAKPYIVDGMAWRGAAPRIGDGTEYKKTAVKPANFFE